jgi:hypothetical protein
MLFQLDNIKTVWFKLRHPPFIYFVYLPNRRVRARIGNTIPKQISSRVLN